jgi:transcriptional regulator GlxA family with amidase domain
VCSGAFLLGAAGLLDGKRVVTHWLDCDRLAVQFPSARVERQPIYIEYDSLWSSAGVTAGIDMSLALVARDLGQATALAVARDLVVFMKRPGGQAQFSSMLALQSKDDEFERLHNWIIANLDGDLSVAALASVAGKSERSFIRHYKSKTGRTPARAVEVIRVEAARQLLIDSSAPIKRIARTCGFGTEETMRRSFVRVLESTPQSVRMLFRNS